MTARASGARPPNTFGRQLPKSWALDNHGAPERGYHIAEPHSGLSELPHPSEFTQEFFFNFFFQAHNEPGTI